MPSIVQRTARMDPGNPTLKMEMHGILYLTFLTSYSRCQETSLLEQIMFNYNTDSPKARKNAHISYHKT